MRALRCVLRASVEYYLRTRTHLSLGKDASPSAKMRPSLDRSHCPTTARSRRFPPWWPSPPVRTPRRVTRLLTGLARRTFHSTSAMASPGHYDSFLEVLNKSAPGVLLVARVHRPRYQVTNAGPKCVTTFSEGQSTWPSTGTLRYARLGGLG
jgi:hypothetical protein